MIELTFLEFHQQRYEERQFCLYVVKNEGGDILYVGISTNDVWERWFGWGGHMTWDGQILYGESPIGINIQDHLLASLQWKIQLWTLQDCLRFCGNELPEDTSSITVHDVEPIMIQKLLPVLNVTYNSPPQKLPASRGKAELKQWPLRDQLITVEEIDRFLDYLRCSANTRFAYRNALEQFVKAVGLDARLDTSTYIKFLLSLQEKSPSTQRVYTTAVLKFYKYCRAGDQTELQEVTQRYRHKTTKKIVDFDFSAVEKVIAYCESLDADTSDSLTLKLEALRDRAFVLTLADTGLRISEACSLRCGDVIWSENRAFTIGRDSRQALIRFSNRAMQALTDYIAARTSVEEASSTPPSLHPVFARHDIRASKKIKPITAGGMWKAIKTRIEESGLQRNAVRIHDFRHYFVTMTYLTKRDLKLSQELARHGSISTTRRYAHFGKEADAAYDDIFNKGQTS